MSSLTPEQASTVAQWVQAGISIAEIQNRIQREFAMQVTYMDTRFIIDDLNLDLPEPEEPEEAPEEADILEPDPDGVILEVDALTVPGSIISGTVKFSDGAKAKWHVDQMGRLGLSPETEGYRPSEEDIQAFQIELKKEFEKKGYA